MNPNAGIVAPMITFVIIGMLGVVALYTIYFAGPKHPADKAKEEDGDQATTKAQPNGCSRCGSTTWKTIELETPEGSAEYYCECSHCGCRTQTFDMAHEAELAWKAQEGLERSGPSSAALPQRMKVRG